MISDKNTYEVMVYIEISKNSHIKYEYDENLNALICDRVLPTPFYFPFNYGFIPNTLSGDGDTVDAIIYMEEELLPSTYIKCKIIGALETIDEKGEDIKIILVPINKVSFNEANINDITDLPSHFIDKITHFYKHYKDLEQGKFVKINKLLNKCDAIIEFEKTLLN